MAKFALATFDVQRDSRGKTYTKPLHETITPTGSFGAKATHVVVWYNRETRDWVVHFGLADGTQVGASDYMYNIDDAASWADGLVEQAHNERWNHAR